MPTRPVNSRAAWSMLLLSLGLSAPTAGAPPEVRGTWLTTTANGAISTREATAETMRRLRSIGLNTVYVEVWKNGYTQFPSRVLEKTIGVDRKPSLLPVPPDGGAPRDLLAETLEEAHRNGLVYVAWFEYGFMVAHKNTDNHLRRMKKEWLSLDLKGNEVAPNGFVWMNPLHPEARAFLLDLVLEAVDQYDLDGVQLDDRIVWPHVTMGYDPFTREVYAREHQGAQPPEDCTDPAWIRWRAEKVDEYARRFADEVRARRPGLLISLSPAVYPWSYDNYCLEWPRWGDWKTGASWAWDEFVPQCYRVGFPAFAAAWNEQVRWMNELGGGRARALLAGIRVVGDGPDSKWDDLRRAIELSRRDGGGHVLWFSKGVFKFEGELTEFYDVAGAGHAPHPSFPAGWRGEPGDRRRELSEPPSATRR